MMARGRGTTPELDTLSNLLEIVTDPNKHASRLKELTEATAVNQAYVDGRAKLNEIDAMLAQAKSSADQSSQVIQNAKDKAAEILDNAKRQEDESISRVHASMEKLAGDRHAFDEHVTQKTEELNAREKSVHDRELTISDRAARLDALEKRLMAEQADIERKKSLLAQL